MELNSATIETICLLIHSLYGVSWLMAGIHVYFKNHNSYLSTLYGSTDGKIRMEILIIMCLPLLSDMVYGIEVSISAGTTMANFMAILLIWLSINIWRWEPNDKNKFIRVFTAAAIYSVLHTSLIINKILS